MYLKSLEMQGFKSFPDRTKLEFGQGATVIIGPNGSGKSNISDAMRWVLGEISSKSIRGSKMEDIIFGGADSRRPMGFAEVSVTFDNTDEVGKIDCPYDEVTVTRKYFRGGDSEYYINKKACRLRDIYELFMNTGIGRDGYSIIGQGKIAEIISRKDDERRSIFEDAAGIAKFRHQKNDSERKLKATEDNMERAADILAELSGRIGPLERECVKAKRYVEYYEIKKEADVRLWLYDTEKIRDKIKAAEDAFRQSSFELEKINEELDALSSREEALSSEMASSKLHSESLNNAIKQRMTDNHNLDSDIKIGESDIRHTKELLESADSSIEAIRESIESAKRNLITSESDCKSKEEEILAANEEILKSEEAINAISEKIKDLRNKLAEAFADIQELESELSKNNARCAVIESSGSADTDKHISLEGEIARFEEKLEASEKKLSAINSTISDYENAINREKSSYDDESEKLAILREKCREAEEAKKYEQLNIDRLTQRIHTLKSMEEQFEGYNHSVRFVMKEYKEGRLGGKIYGPLSTCLSVSQEYLTAIETSLGASLQHIVVEDESTAKGAIRMLKEKRAGRATFYPITSMSEGAARIPSEVEKAKSFRGYVGRAAELVSFDKKFTPVIESLLGRVVVFEDIESANKMAKALSYKIRTVTLDGQQINYGGSFTGGSVREDSSLLSRAGEIKKLEESLKDANKAYDKASKSFTSLSAEYEESENELISADERIRIMQSMKAAEESEAEKIKASLDADKVLIENLKDDLLGLSSKKKQFEEELEEISKHSRETEEKIDAIREYRRDTEVELAEAEDELEDAQKAQSERRIRAGILEGELSVKKAALENARASIGESNDKITSEKEKIEEFKNKIAFLEDVIAEKKTELKEGEETLVRLTKEREETEKGNLEFEKRMNDLRANVKLKNDARDSAQALNIRNESELQRQNEEQERISGILWTDYTMTRADAVACGYEPLTEESRPEVVKTQTDYRNKLRAMGSVNVGAIDEYKEVKERHDKLSADMEDLTAAKNKLVRVIADLEREMRTAFSDTFNRINENFGKTFKELFGGGSAELILTDPEDVLTSGIEIKAAPPGKIIKSLVQLSGGEQSFVAIALFFAILGVNPTPFCILDEIEAALDEVNVDRLAKYINRYSGKTQFILITHRRGTMDAADILYGVTMPERGISKVLTLNVAEISKQKGEEWDGIFG